MKPQKVGIVGLFSKQEGPKGPRSLT